MGLYEQYKTSSSFEENGVWVDFGDGIRVKVRRLNSDKSRDVRKQLEAPYSAQMRRGQELPDSVSEEILKKQICHGVVIAWEGVTDEKGKVLDFTPDNAYKVFTDLPDFLNDVATASATRATFKELQIEEAKGN